MNSPPPIFIGYAVGIIAFAGGVIKTSGLTGESIVLIVIVSVVILAKGG